MKNKKPLCHLFTPIVMSGLFDKLSDRDYLSILYYTRFGRKLNLKNPKTFNEKIQWLKLYDRRPEYVIMVDKYKAREFIRERIGEEYLIPLLGVWDNPDEIKTANLGDKFVLKCNHNSGGVQICHDVSSFNMDNAIHELSIELSKDYYLRGREWPYKEVKRKIIAEKLLENVTGAEVADYKLMCFNGVVKCSFVCTDRYSKDGLKVTFFDREWIKMDFQRHYPASIDAIKKPLNYEKMIYLAEKLSNGYPFLRVDFYEIDNKIYIGELTLYPGSGLEEFQPEKWDYIFGDYLMLP